MIVLLPMMMLFQLKIVYLKYKSEIDFLQSVQFIFTFFLKKKVAIIGKSNCGKSSLLNRLLGSVVALVCFSV